MDTCSDRARPADGSRDRRARGGAPARPRRAVSARASASSTSTDALIGRPCSSHVYQLTETPASSATSSRRRPGVRRRGPGSSPTSSRCHRAAGAEEGGEIGTTGHAGILQRGTPARGAVAHPGGPWSPHDHALPARALEDDGVAGWPRPTLHLPRPALARRATRARSSEIRDLLRVVETAGRAVARRQACRAPSRCRSPAGPRAPSARCSTPSGPTGADRPAVRTHRGARRAACRSSHRGPPARPHSARRRRVLVTTGSQQAIGLVVRALVDPGETVVVEDPLYLGTRQVLDAYGARLAPIPVDDDGLDVDRLGGALAVGAAPEARGGRAQPLEPVGRDARTRPPRRARRRSPPLRVRDPRGRRRITGSGSTSRRRRPCAAHAPDRHGHARLRVEDDRPGPAHRLARRRRLARTHPDAAQADARPPHVDAGPARRGRAPARPARSSAPTSTRSARANATRGRRTRRRARRRGGDAGAARRHVLLGHGRRRHTRRAPTRDRGRCGVRARRRVHRGARRSPEPAAELRDARHPPTSARPPTGCAAAFRPP